MKTILDMTLEELRAVPNRENWQGDLGPFDGVVFVPGGGRKKDLHDSGFRTLQVIGCHGWRPIVAGATCSDHVEFLAPEVQRWRFEFAPNFDCLPKSGCIRAWLRTGRGFIFESALSSTSIRIERVSFEDMHAAFKASLPADALAA